MLNWEELKKVQDAVMAAAKSILDTDGIVPGLFLLTQDTAAAEKVGMKAMPIPGMDAKEKVVGMALKFSRGDLVSTYMTYAQDDFLRITLLGLIKVVQREHAKDGIVRPPANAREEEEWHKEVLELFMKSQHLTLQDLEDAIVAGILKRVPAYATIRVGAALMRNYATQEEYKAALKETTMPPDSKECLVSVMRDGAHERVSSVAIQRRGIKYTADDIFNVAERRCTAGIGDPIRRVAVEGPNVLATSAASD